MGGSGGSARDGRVVGPRILLHDNAKSGVRREMGWVVAGEVRWGVLVARGAVTDEMIG